MNSMSITHPELKKTAILGISDCEITPEGKEALVNDVVFIRAVISNP